MGLNFVSTFGELRVWTLWDFEKGESGGSSDFSCRCGVDYCAVTGIGFWLCISSMACSTDDAHDEIGRIVLRLAEWKK